MVVAVADLVEEHDLVRRELVPVPLDEHQQRLRPGLSGEGNQVGPTQEAGNFGLDCWLTFIRGVVPLVPNQREPESEKSTCAETPNQQLA